MSSSATFSASSFNSCVCSVFKADLTAKFSVIRRIFFISFSFASISLSLIHIYGEKKVKLFGEEIEVRARIESLHGVSGHADKEGLLAWLKGFRSPIERVFVVHGEDEVTEEFARTIEENLQVKAWAPYPCGQVDLLSNEILDEGVRIPIKAKKAVQKKADSAYERLMRAGRYLLDVITRNEGMSNKDKAKFESQIQNLADVYKRQPSE